MKFTVERDALAEAVTWVARALPARPVVPVLPCLLLSADAGATGTRSRIPCATASLHSESTNAPQGSERTAVVRLRPDFVPPRFYTLMDRLGLPDDLLLVGDKMSMAVSVDRLAPGS